MTCSARSLTLSASSRQWPSGAVPLMGSAVATPSRTTTSRSGEAETTVPSGIPMYARWDGSPVACQIWLANDNALPGHGDDRRLVRFTW